MSEARETNRQSDRAGTIAVIVIGLFILIAANVPHILGFVKSSDDHVFSGTLSNNLDQLSYYAKMRAGLKGNWTYENLYTTEPTKPVPIFIYYIVLGWFARMGGLSVIAMSQLARVGAGAFFLFMLDRLARALGWRGGKRVFALALVGVGSGVGWIHGFAFADQAIEFRPLEYWLIEGYVFQSLANYSHFALGTALVVGALTDSFLASRDGWTVWRILRVAACSFVLGWVHPRLIAIPVVVCAIAGVVDYFGKREIPKGWLTGALLIAIAGLPPGVFMLLAIRGDDVWRTTLEPVMLSPGLGQLIEGYGLVWPLAGLGVWAAIRESDSGMRWVAGWFVAGCLLIWLPMDSQRRLIQGLNIPMAMLGVAGLDFGVRRWFPSCECGVKRWVCASLIVFVTSIGSGFYLSHEVARIQRGRYPTFWTEEYAAGLAWLERFGRSDEVVLASLENGALIPAMTGRRVVLGHWAETYRAAEKSREVREFFDTATTSERRAEIIEKHKVTMIVLHDQERELGGYDPASQPEVWTEAWKGIEMRFYRRAGLPKLDRAGKKGAAE